MFADPVVGAHCKSCEYRIDQTHKSKGLKSAFEECWTKALGVRDFERPLVFELWNFRRSDQLIEDGRYYLDEVTEEDINVKPREGGFGLSQSQRQFEQVKRAASKTSAPYIDVEGLAYELSQWRYPLNFIDFETTMVAIPFNKGRRPYEQIAFQFSHHIVEEDGTVRHETQYINRLRGVFPNYDFVRHLRAALSQNSGTIFRFAQHENTVLNQISQQLEADQKSVPDALELIAWIRTVTTPGGSDKRSGASWKPTRQFVDLCEVIKNYYYHPLTKGSNSIKKVLPAVLTASTRLQAKYSKPIYGGNGPITSKNFQFERAWVTLDEEGVVLDPYKTLEPVFADIEQEAIECLFEDDFIKDGGAAMTAYARMQFTEMSDAEADRIAAALLRYCELDTFAMVMVFEHLKELVESHAACSASTQQTA